MSSSDERNVHAEWIAAAEKHSGLNGTELASELGIGETVLSKYRCGRRTPPRRIMDGLITLAGFSHDDYLAGPGGAN